ncbi:Protein of unknown function [Flavobacterium aquidurense]|uniref:Uncharacterized protein n=1 Tax=Flavobacterium frigidimaris TaxID=262320 RepID=A0ABX4BQ12_FLAFR|nr:DUF3408 domain-containing protein [Flavobacterium frigidimaris]OXA78973.1 hypothetical protein B0A65_12160 [Flavobacterium frigidimaris]SDZ51005.1 Protein of unknown function [Flavobacterium aquidurense]
MKNLFKNSKLPVKIWQYRDIFLQPTEFIARNGKSVYISEDFHRKISRIVFILTDGKITISDYMYNVPKQYFHDFGEDIKALHIEKQKTIL